MKSFNYLVSKMLITESPIFSDSKLSINLDDERINKHIVTDCIQRGKRVKNFEDWEVYKIEKEQFIYFCFIKNNIVEAYAEFFIDKRDVNSKRVLQKKSNNSKGLLRRAFLNYFSDIFLSVKLDNTANVYGKQFFKKLMSEATSKGFKTTVVDENTKSEAPYQDKNFEQYWSGKTIINDKFVRYYNLIFKIYYK